MSNLPFLKLFPISGHSISITSHSIHKSNPVPLQTKMQHRQNEKSHVCLLLTQRNQVLLEHSQHINPYSNYLNIRRNPQGQTTNNSLKLNSSCAPNTQLKSQCFHTIHKHHLCAELIPWRVYVPGFSYMHFSLSPSPLCNYNVRCHSAGGGRRRKRKERVVN